MRWKIEKKQTRKPISTVSSKRWCLPHFFHNLSYWRVLQGYYSTATEGKINLSLPKVKAAMNQLCTRGCLELLSNVDWHLHILLGCNLAYFSIYNSQSVQFQFHFAFPLQYLIKPLKFTSCSNSILNKFQLSCSILRGEIIQTFHVIFVKHFLGKYWTKSIRKWLISPFFGNFMIRLSVNYQHIQCCFQHAMKCSKHVQNVKQLVSLSVNNRVHYTVNSSLILVSNKWSVFQQLIWYKTVWLTWWKHQSLFLHNFEIFPLNLEPETHVKVIYSSHHTYSLVEQESHHLINVHLIQNHFSLSVHPLYYWT